MTMTSSDSQNLSVPIASTLRRLIRRARLVVALRGAAATLATAVGTLLVVMAVDATVTIFSASARWALSLSAAALTCLAAWRLLVRPLRRSFTLTGIARIVEVRHPELQERISSAIELLSSGDQPEMRGSQALIRQLAVEADQQIHLIRPAREFTYRPARPFFAAAALVIIVLAAVWAAWPQRTGLLVARALSPHSQRLGNIRSDQLEIHPGDAVVPIGTTIDVDVTVHDDRVDSAQLLVREPGGSDSRRPMVRLPDEPGQPPRFVLPVGPLRSDIQYRVLAGDALSGYFDIRAVAAPEPHQITVTLNYPEYTGLEARTTADSDGSITALRGTKAVISVTTNKPVGEAVLHIGEHEIPAELLAHQGGATVATFNLALDDPAMRGWSLALVDHDGLTNTPTEYPIEVLDDQPPTVTLNEPGQTRLRLRPDERVGLVFDAADDVGIAAVQLAIKIDGRAIESVELPVANDPRPRSLTGARAVLDLSKLELDRARRVSCHIETSDCRPDAQRARSREVRIDLDAAAPTLALQATLADEVKIAQALREAIIHMKQAQQHSGPLDKRVEVRGELGEQAQNSVKTIAERSAAAEKLLEDLAAELAGGSFADIGQKVRQIARENIVPARSGAERIALLDKPGERATEARNCDFQVQRSIERMEQLLDEARQLARLAQEAQQLADLAQRQADLTAEAEAMAQAAEPSAVDQQQWQQQQSAVAGELQEMVKASPSAMAQAIQQRQEATRDLVAEARRLAQQQQELVDQSELAKQAADARQELQKLAAQQRELASRAEKMKLAPQHADEMRKAAEDIEAARAQAADAKQQSQEKALAARASELDKEQAVKDLAKEASEIAARQKRLANQAAALDKQRQTALSAAAAAQKQAQQARQQHDQASQAVTEAMKQLRRDQQALADEASKDTASASQPADDGAAEAMDQAAGALASARTLEQAKAAAAKAHEALAGRKDDQAAAQLAKRQQDILAGIDNAARKAEQATKAAARADHAAKRQARQVAAADAVVDKLAELTQAQVETGQQLDHLSKKLAGADEPTKATASKARAAANEARQDLEAKKSAQAARSTANAADQTKALADRLTKAAGDLPEAPDAEDVAKLSADQKQLREQTAKALANHQQQAAKATEAARAQLLRRQKQLASQASALADRVTREAPQDDRVQVEAAQHARGATEKLAGNEPAQAADAATNAGEKLAELARRLEKQEPSPAGESGDDEGPIRQQAQKLADDQKKLAEEIDALARGNPAKAMAGSQEELAGKVEEFAGAVEAIDQFGRELMGSNKDAQTKAAQAAQSAGQARQQAQAAGQQLRSAKSSQQLASGQQAQQQAEQSLQGAAQALGQLGENIAQAAADARQQASSDDAQLDPEQLTGALDAAAEAAAQATPSAAERAQQNIQTLAQTAMAQAQAMGLMLGTMSAANAPPGQSQDEPLGMGQPRAMLTNLSPAQLRELGLSPADWVRLPGTLQDEIIQAMDQQGPAEYRDLIRRYFEQRSKQAAGKEGRK